MPKILCPICRTTFPLDGTPEKDPVTELPYPVIVPEHPINHLMMSGKCEGSGRLGMVVKDE